MWTKRLISPSPEFPQGIDLIRHLLKQMMQARIQGSWLHLETVKQAGFLGRLFSVPPAFVEVGFSEGCFELNLGFQKDRQLEIPSSWSETGKGLRNVPYADLEALGDWIERLLSKAVSESSNKSIIGWIDGL